MARLARRLRAARINAQLTVREAAELAALPEHSILVRYENGAVQPPLERVAALARAYSTTLSALLAERDESVSLIAAIDQANPTTVQRLQALLKTHLVPQPPRSETDVPF